MIYTPATFTQTMLDHVCRAMTLAGCAEIERAYPAVGLLAWDTCGQLTVGPERVYRSTSFPIESLDAEFDCFVGFIAVQVVVTLTRCAPSGDDAGNPPTVEQLTAHHASILHDAAVIWNALNGALPDDWERANLSQQFLGNEGGIIAIETRLVIGLDSETWCP